MTRPDYRRINATVRYEMFSVFQVRPGALGEDRSVAIGEARAFFVRLADTGVTLRGLYHLAGLRANADWMVWTHAESVETLQCVYNDLRRTTALGRASTPVWSAAAVHRPAEFNKTHVPAFLAGEAPGAYLCVYPFVRSTTGICCPRPIAARCSPTTASRHVTTRTCGRTPWRRSRLATTSGSSRSRPQKCTESST
jgi:hydrogen peroxide-dependent heme synthase